MRSTSFYFSFLVLPKPKRQAIIAVWDFCHAVDDAVDLAPDSVRATEALEVWRDEVARLFDGGTPETEQGRQLRPFIDRCHLPRKQFEALTEGVGMDAVPRRYETFADLEPYCHRVASAVGLICAEIFEYRDEAALEYARDLGVALQLTNILRDVGVDFRVGRVYLPQEDLAHFGCTEEDIRREVEQAGRGVNSAAMRQVLERQAARARVYFSRATRALPRDHASNFVAAEIMRTVYFDLLRRIEARACDVFTDVVRVPRPYQAWLAARTWLGAGS
jgi:phytoene synthase